MPFLRTPSPNLDGGWSSPGLDISSGRSTPISSAFPSFDRAAGRWQTPKMRGSSSSTQTFSAHHKGLFTRHMRRLSSNLPRWSSGAQYMEKDKPMRRPTMGLLRRIPPVSRMLAMETRIGRKARLRTIVMLFLVLGTILLYMTPLYQHWRRSLGGGKKFVMILAANVGGGVIEWKGAREWAIERDSVKNKRRYAARWGYDLEIIDMSTKKRYAHEWRESWEKVDFIRNTLRKYPRAEWVWWLDLNTFIMEPSYSLQHHIFDDLASHVYRDINEYNPLGITHPLTDHYLDSESLSPVGDGRPESVNLILSQDCSGFNLGSFFMRRSEWTDQMLDIWWDPVAYEQKHMQWEHKEQDALEQLYTTQPWIRKHTAFIPQRMINSFPVGACSDNGNDTRIHYDPKDRDFIVNMAGCQWGRDCWSEMYNFRELSNHLNRNLWRRFKEDLLAVLWLKLAGQKPEH